MKENKVHIFRNSKGQIVIDGAVLLTDEKGNELPHGERFTLSGSGRSKRMPFCDSSHKEIDS